MSKDELNFENELIENEFRELEKEFGLKISQLEQAPLRQEFQENLRSLLQTTVLNKGSQQERALSENRSKENPEKDKQKHALDMLRNMVSSCLRVFKRRKVQLTAGILLVAFIFGTLFWDGSGYNPVVTPVYAGEITISALETDELGVKTDSAFLITSKNPLDEKTVKNNLQIEPAFAYKLKKGAGGREYQIIPQKELLPDTIYRLSFDPKGKGRENFSWAFQTQSDFQVMRTLPGNKTVGVPLDTGIEITFTHENFDLAKVKKFFQISPQVEGRFEQHKKTLVFVPQQQLQPETLYTVTLRKGLTLLGSKETLAEDYSFSFETKGREEEKFNFEIDNNLVEFSTTEAPFFSVYFSSEEKAPPVLISLYRYENSQDFSQALAKKDQFPTWSYHTRRNYKEDLSDLTKYAEYKTEFLSVDRWTHYLIFPEELPAGYYVAEIEVEEVSQQVWFQVTDLAVYLVQDEEKNLFWVNDLKTNSPVVEATVYLQQGKRSFKGNEQGVVVAEFVNEKGTQRTSEQSKGGSVNNAVAQDYAVVKKDDQEIVVPVFTRQQAEQSQVQQIQSRDYWKYLYLDRELFKPGDMVNFWGVLAPRKGAEPLREVVVELMGIGANYYQREEAPILSQKVPLQQEIFTGCLELPVLNPGYYYLRIKSGETTFLSRGFSVQTYQKPAYKITVEPEKKAIFAGESVNFLAKAAFFEGTPVPKVSLNYSIWEQRGTVNTNAQGVATIPFVAKINTDDNDYYYGNAYRSFYLGVNAALPEAGEISTDSNVLVFASKVYLEGEVKRDGNGFVLSGQLSHVNLDKVNQGEDPERDNFVSGPAVGYPVKGKVIQEKWKKTEGGERYNFITKKVEKRYYYSHYTEQIGEFETVTDHEGKVYYQGDYQLDPEGSYYLDLIAQDQEGRQIKKRLYIFQNRGYESDYKYYQLQTEKVGEKYIPGDKVILNFTENEQKMDSRKQGYLFYQGQKTIDTYKVSDQSQYTFNFTEEYIPNINVGAVYFDGIAYHEVYPTIVPYDPASKELKVTIETDKSEYRPKDKVKLSLLVTDQQGKPVQAKVNLNLVDEALYSMVDQRVDILSRLYTDYLRLTVRTRSSHVHPDFVGGAERGGEGEGERKDFFDTVLFTTVETNSRGRASAEFTLPDNLTSWRLTYHGVSSDLQVVSGTAQIPVRLSFFVEMVFKETYLEGDTPVIVVRSYGEKVATNTPVSYEMALTTPTGETIVQKKQGQVAVGTDWQLPVLQVGKYKLTVEGQVGEYRDKLSHEFTVIDSFLERTLSTHQILTEKTKLKGGAVEPTTVVFSDYEKSQYLRGLYSLAWQHGGRLEQKLASREARKLLSQYFSDGQELYAADEEESLLVYQQYDGGVGILPYAESELELTALVASVSSNDFDYGAMSGYFYNIMEKGEEAGEDLTLALWGLGALGKPVLIEINKYLEQEDLSPAEKVHLALALLDIGDGAYAYQVYAELLEQYGENLGNSLRMKIGRDQDEIIAATTQMALLAARLDAPEKNRLYQYVLENPGTEILNNLEQLQILKYNLQYMENVPVSFVYELNGKKEKKELEGRETFTLTVLPQDLAKLKFSEITGKVGVMTAYSETYDREDIAGRDDLQVSRTYLVNQKKTTMLERGDLVEVVLNYEIKDLAPSGSYELVDILPAGLSYVQRPYNRTEKLSVNWRYPAEVKGQKITFNVWKEKKTGQTVKPRPIVYYARVVSPGEFIAQGTLLSHSKNNDFCILGQEDRVVIK